jgi:hypothetical protein
VTPLEHALAYAALGWRVAPIKPGFKFPKGMEDWQERATTDEATIRKWWGKYPTYGVSIVAGVISDIVWLDVDPRHGGDETLADLEHEHGKLPDTVESLTGGGGRHIGFKMPRCPTCKGDDQLHTYRCPDCVGGRLIITNDAGKRLGPGLDVRGEGGQIVAPPSVHPETGRAYAWEVFNNPLDGAEVADMPAWLVSMLTAPLTAPTPRREPRTTGTRLMERPGDRYNAETAWADILSADGWTIHSGRRGRDGDYELWTRPGKTADEGASASLYYGGSNSLKVFSGAPEMSAMGLTQDTAYDPLGYLAARKHGGDIGRAVKALGDLYRMRDAPKQVVVYPSVDNPVVLVSNFVPPPNVDPTTGEITPIRNLPDDFWNSRQVLATVRQAAHSRLISADAVLLCILARVSALTPPTYQLPPIVGSRGSLNFIAALVGRSGTGKSSAADVAEELLPIERDDIVQLQTGSGEGLIESYFEMSDELNEETGKISRVKKQTKRSALFKLDEGQALNEMASRKGSTLMTNLRSAWTGGQVGQANATQETFRMLKAHSYRMAMQMGFQLEYAAALIGDAAGGTPQRFAWASSIDPAIPDDDVEWPGELKLPTLDIIHTGTTIAFAPSIRAEIRARKRAANRGDVVMDSLDGHADLVRMKVAALLSLLNSELDVTEEDWQLAGEVMRVSVLVRSWALEHARAVAAAGEEAVATRLGKRTLTAEEMQHSKALESGSKSLARKVWRMAPTDAARGPLNEAVAGKHREHCSIDDMIARAIGEQWITASGDAYQPGPNRPPGL